VPNYDFKCNRCNHTEEHFLPYESRNSTFPCRCGGTIRHVWLTAPGIACHGCPSYMYRRERSEQEVRRHSDKRMQDRNRDEILHSANHKWSVSDVSREEMQREAHAARTKTSDFAP